MGLVYSLQRIVGLARVVVLSVADTAAAIAAAIEIYPPNLSDDQVARLLDFLEALTDFSAEDARKTVPARVPSGLPLAEIN